MNDEIKEILEFKENADYKKLSCDEIKVLRDYITNLEQENERLNRQLKHYWKYRSDIEEQKEVYDILELGKDLKNLHKHKNTGGLLWIDLPMTLFSSLTSYIRARDVMLEDYKLRIEKAVEYGNSCINKDLDLETLDEPYKTTFKTAYEIHNNYLDILNGKE